MREENKKILSLLLSFLTRIEIDVICSQKQSVILRMLWLAYYNPETDWRTEEVKILRCPEECGKQ